MQLHDIPQFPKSIQHPVQIYDGDRLVAVALPPERYEQYRLEAAQRLKVIMDQIGEKTKDLTKEEIMDLLEIDEEEYVNLGY